MERRWAESGGGAFEATDAGRLAVKTYHALPEIRISSAAIPAVSGTRTGRFFDAADVGFACAGTPTCSE